MYDTLNRLHTAQILLSQAVNSTNTPDIFRANFNAFLSTARSVTWIMQKEFKNFPGFDDWYNEKKFVMKKDKML